MKNFWNFHRVNFNSHPLNLLTLFWLLTILLASVGCKKEFSSIGLDLKDDLLNATFTDSTTLMAYSVREDSLNTTNLVFNYLGLIQDPVFGTTTAGIYTQFIPSGNNVNFGKNTELDSIVLTLRYTGGFYGDTLNPFSIKVYELKEEISAKDTFYQYSSIAYNEMNLTYISDFRLYPTPNTKVKLDTLLEAHVRIRLDDELGKRFLENAEKMKTNGDFKAFFKGLYICAEHSSSAHSGSLVNFTLNNTGLSGIQLYYKDNGVAKRFSFIVKAPETVRFSVYHHDYENGEPNFVNQVIHKNTLLGEKKLYVQSLGGVKTKIEFPHLKALKNKKILINKAELVITNIGEDLHLYPSPTRLGIQGVNRKGDVVFLPDQYVDVAYFGGSYNSTTKEYRFRITRYVQNLILKDDFKPYIYLVATGAAANANRLLFSGTKFTDGYFNKAQQLRLELYYTEY